ncbi:MAG: transporter [Gammaproteobacteria bacterium RIFCSPHIGHO2_12_FULL_41_15]|nr:MAG: transporter [Gammaproteobacteria bacterium RIFCSPHIGHO2_12_FULL_41_15]
MLSTSNRQKTLSVFGLAMINVVAIDSLRNLPTEAVFGISIISFYFIAALFFLLPCVLLTAELATHYPKTGGSYVWVREAFGKKWGFFNIWLQWVYNVVWYPTILSFVAASIAYLIDPPLASNKTYMICMIIGMFSFATLINCFGMKLSSFVSTIGAIVGTLVPMLFIIILATFWWAFGKPTALTFNTSDILPNLNNWQDFALFGTVIFSVMGIEMSSVHAGDVKNPKRDYPLALILSSVLIVVSSILATLSIAIVLPKNQLSIVSGMNQAFKYFLDNFHLGWLEPIAILTMITGGFCCMATWVIGPIKGLMVAAEDGCAPKIFGKTNRYGAPTAMLIAQWGVVLLLCTAYALFPTVTSAYWILADLTTQLALVFYILLFLAAIKLHLNLPEKIGSFKIPGGKLGGYVVGGVGILTASITILLGFIPPETVKVGSVWSYELTLIIGMLIFALPPLFIARNTPMQ